MLRMFKRDVDKMARQLLENDTKTYTRNEIREFFGNRLAQDQLIRIYKRYVYLKNKNTLL